jgi:predicted NUDIX family NTP pyrophosphohydrolase
MKQIAAGLLMFRKNEEGLSFFLAHPGGPFFKKKDNGFWSIPKGLIEEGEEYLDAAKREFEEETGIKPVGPFIELGYVKYKGGKTIYAWAFESNTETVVIASNTFQIEWPPKSGKIQTFPEIDKADYFSLDEALVKINEAQKQFILRLMDVKHS